MGGAQNIGGVPAARLPSRQPPSMAAEPDRRWIAAASPTRPVDVSRVAEAYGRRAPLNAIASTPQHTLEVSTTPLLYRTV
eukprot:jgi/Tetstr1/445873/TSEL_033512.t1